MDYEEAVYEKQERLYEDSDIDLDDCSICEKIELCRKASAGQGEYPSCPLMRGE